MSEEEAIPESVETEETPTPDENATTTGPLAALEGNGERFRGFLRIVFAVILGVLIMGDVALYSLYQSVKSRVDSQEHRLERLNSMVSDLMMANENAEKIEKIEQQVNGIDGQMQELTSAIKAQDAKAEAPPEPEPEPKKKKR